MKKSALLLAFAMGFSPILGAGSVEESNNSVTASSLDQLIVQTQSIKFDKDSQQVGEAYCYFNGQNIQSARDVHYALWFKDGKCSIETLYGLYLALQGFLLPGGQVFAPKDLNDGLTKDTLNF